MMIEVDGRCESLSYVSSIGIYSSVNATNAVVGLTEVVAELVRLREEVTELKRVGIYPYNAEATDSIIACCRICR